MATRHVVAQVSHSVHREVINLTM